jgi:hypothetical protein
MKNMNLRDILLRHHLLCDHSAAAAHCDPSLVSRGDVAGAAAAVDSDDYYFVDCCSSDIAPCCHQYYRVAADSFGRPYHWLEIFEHWECRSANLKRQGY